jgi:hypothetical protein
MIKRILPADFPFPRKKGHVGFKVFKNRPKYIENSDCQSIRNSFDSEAINLKFK